MDHEFQRISQLFDAARQCDPSARLDFLSDACGSNLNLRERVMNLLRQHDRAAGFLEPPTGARNALEGAFRDVYTSQLSELPERIGSYRILDILGEGGMGVVYLAEQTAPVVRRVALKLIKRGLSNRQFIARLEAERQALAMMDHPNITRVI